MRPDHNTTNAHDIDCELALPDPVINFVLVDI